MVLHGIVGRCQCHVPDMVLHGIVGRCQCHVQTWFYMGSHIDADSLAMVLHEITYRCQSMSQTCIDVVQWFSFQTCAFKGHDESSRSKNRGNFLELFSPLASYDEKVEHVLKGAPQNASYTSSTIQKKRIVNLCYDRKFSIIVDEVRDESKKRANVYMKDTASLTLKNVIFNVLLQHSFDIQNIRGQGYDGPTNMLGEFNRLQTLILNDCRYAYYVNCFAHYLQLALVVAAREVVEVHQFFKDLFDIVNVASASSKQHDELQKAQVAEITHFYPSMKVLGVTDNLFQAFQRRFQNILNAISLILTTKDLIQKLRDDGLKELLKKCDIFFCETWELNFPDMNAQYILQELKGRFNEHVVELLILTIALDPFKLFNIDKVFIFCKQEERILYELKHYELDVCKHPDLRKISTLSELCRSLVESGKSVMYPLIDRLIRLILTLPVSTAFAERVFSAMKIVKTRLHSKMEDDFLRSSFIVYIEKEFVEKFDVNKTIDDFSEVKDRRVQLK
ncbi:hypothetical protein V6Z11_A11G246700 [Gossypium hirsutum]